MFSIKENDDVTSHTQVDKNIMNPCLLLFYYDSYTHGTSSSFSSSTGSESAWMDSMAVEYAASLCFTDLPLWSCARNSHKLYI